MIEILIVIFLILWLLGMVSGQIFGGLLHVLLLVAHSPFLSSVY